MFVDVLELTENYMVGRFHGELRRYDDFLERHVFAEISVDFRAGAWDGGGDGEAVKIED